MALLAHEGEALGPGRLRSARAALHEHSGVRGEQWHECGKVCRQLALAQIVRGIEQRHVPGRARRVRTRRVEERLHRLLHNVDLRHRIAAKSAAHHRGVSTRDLRGLRVLLDERDADRAAACRLKAEGAGPCIEIEHARAADETPRFERREDRLPHTVACRTRA